MAESTGVKLSVFDLTCPGIAPTTSTLGANALYPLGHRGDLGSKEIPMAIKSLVSDVVVVLGFFVCVKPHFSRNKLSILLLNNFIPSQLLL